jgi:hypothetical protein
VKYFRRLTDMNFNIKIVVQLCRKHLFISTRSSKFLGLLLHYSSHSDRKLYGFHTDIMPFIFFAFYIMNFIKMVAYFWEIYTIQNCRTLIWKIINLRHYLNKNIRNISKHKNVNAFAPICSIT